MDELGALSCSGVTSSSLPPHIFVFRLRAICAAVESSPREVLSSCRLCSAATTRMDFLCLKRGCCGVGTAGRSVVVGDVPPEGASMTGLSRSCSGKYSSSRSYMTSGGGRGAQVTSMLLSNLLIRSLSRLLVAPFRLGVLGGREVEGGDARKERGLDDPPWCTGGRPFGAVLGEPSMLRGVNGGRVLFDSVDCDDSVDLSFFGGLAQRVKLPSPSESSSSRLPLREAKVEADVRVDRISVVDGGVGSCCTGGGGCIGSGGLRVPSARFSSMKPRHLRSSGRMVCELSSSSMAPRLPSPLPGKVVADD